MARELQSLSKSSVDKGPKTDDELHAWIKKNLKMDIPRVAVCEGHQSPFAFLCDIYFERTRAAVALANRGGSKTILSAIIHFLNSIFKPGTESFTVGAIFQQADRAYDNLKKVIRTHGHVQDAEDHPLVTKIVKSETLFANGSKVEIVPGTMAAVNGPHSQKVHADEVELMDPNVYQESRSISMSKFIETGDFDLDGMPIEKEVLAQDWITSTRKRAHGPMQKILDEIESAIAQGFEPAMKLFTWCIFETAREVPNCQVAYPDQTCEGCKCDVIVKGEWEDGSPRTFKSVCKGRLARSRGFLALGDIYKKFQELDRDTWEAQQECTKPEVGGSVFKQFTRERHGIKYYEPLPQNGPIFVGIDFGGTNPNAVEWFQYLKQDTLVHGPDQKRDDEPAKLLKMGTTVAFDEIYVAEISNEKLFEMVQEKEAIWKAQYEGWTVNKSFGDIAAKAARLTFAERKRPLAWFATRDIKDQIKTCNSMLDGNEFYVDLRKCPMLVEEIEAYHYPPKRTDVIYDPEVPVDDFNHAVSAFRYVMENLKHMVRIGMGGRGMLPKTDTKKYEVKSPFKSGAPRYVPIDSGRRAIHPFTGSLVSVSNNE